MNEDQNLELIFKNLSVNQFTTLPKNKGQRYLVKVKILKPDFLYLKFISLYHQSKMKISIITATYNSAKTIESSMQSVIDQTYASIEHLIVDGSSSDDTLDIVREFQMKYSNIHLTSEPDNGIYDALNKGISKATGDVIGFLHSDDFFENKKVIQQIANSFEVNECDGVYGDLKYVNAENPTQVVRYWRSSPFHQSLLQKGWMPAHPTLFLKKEVYQNYGKFDVSYKIASDYDFMLRVLKNVNFKFEYLPQVITNMRVGGASNRSFKNILRKSKEDYRALQENKIGGRAILMRKNLSKLPQFLKKNKS